MATYFHGNPTDLQAADGLQTLVLMNPTTYVNPHHQQQFSDATPPPQQPPHSNLIFLNSTHAPPSLNTPHFVGIPTTASDDNISPLHGLLPRLHYNLYQPNCPTPTARETTRAKQGLSLSLSPQQQVSYGQGQAVSGEDMRVSGGSMSSGLGVTNGVSGVLLSSKYLKATQELLDEVVHLNNTWIDSKNEFSKKGNGNSSRNTNKLIGESSNAALEDGGEASGKKASEISAAERQDIQMKKAKLINMLEEVCSYTLEIYLLVFFFFLDCL